jgi:hypothetical protein
VSYEFKSTRCKVLFKIKTAKYGRCPKLAKDKNSQDWHMASPNILMHAMYILLSTHRLLLLQNLPEN